MNLVCDLETGQCVESLVDLIGDGEDGEAINASILGFGLSLLLLVAILWIKKFLLYQITL